MARCAAEVPAAPDKFRAFGAVIRNSFPCSKNENTDTFSGNVEA